MDSKRILQKLKRPKLYLPAALGALLGGIVSGMSNSMGVLIADMLFMAALLYLVMGLFSLVVNTGLFDGVTFGFRTWGRIFLNRKASKSGDLGMDYAQYRAARKKKDNYPAYFLLAAVCFAACLLAGIF